MWHPCEFSQEESLDNWNCEMSKINRRQGNNSEIEMISDTN